MLATTLYILWKLQLSAKSIQNSYIINNYSQEKNLPDLSIVSNKIIVSNKLLGLLQLGLGFGSGSCVKLQS